MDRYLEPIIILAAIALSIAFLGRRFLFKGKQDSCGSHCNCAQPDAIKRRP